MIPNATDRKVTGNLSGERVRMAFAEGAEQHLMTLLTDMYSDPEKAIIREYSTNARDSHVEAGNTAPIEVTTPSPLSPYLKITDYGVGLSVEDIHAIYSKYGASTKRGSNEATGMLGIGCKSALTYASQFTVVGIQNGVRTTVAVSRDEDGSNVMTIVDTSTTDDPNGVEVSIPARGGNQIDQKAREFFSFWPKGSVLLNGKEPDQKIVGLEMTDDLTLIQADRYGGAQSVLVMGNVPYPAPDLASHELGAPYGYALIARVPVGAVDFAPSREALQMTRRTKDRIEQIKKDFKRELVAAVQRKIEKAPTPRDAVLAVTEWSRLLGQNRPDSFKFKGKTLPTTLAKPLADGNRMLITSSGTYKMSSASTVNGVDISHMANAVFITDYDPVKLTPTHKKKMIMWVDQENLTNVSNFVLVNFKLDTTWLDPKRVVSWPTVNALVLPKVKVQGGAYIGRLPGSYDTVQTGSRIVREVAGADIDHSEPVYYMHGNVRDGAYTISPVLDALNEKYTVICLPENRLAKFARDNPTIGRAADVLKAKYEAWQKKLTEDERLALYLSDYYNGQQLREVAKAGTTDIDDPAVKKAAKLASTNVDKLQKQLRQLQSTGFFRTDDLKFTDPMEKYPLFDGGVFRSNRKHVVEYMNAVYAGGF